MTDTPTSPKEGFFRRNGKPQSCEPCRKSKVRCDHAYPTCLRCRARNAGAQCVYHPAPLTRPRSQYRQWKPEAAKSSTSSIPSAVSGDSGSPDSLVTPMTSEGGDLHYRIEETGYEKPGLQGGRSRPVVHENGSLATNSTFRPNFLGSTSYGSVFAHSWKTGAAGSAKQWQSPLYDVENVEDPTLSVEKINAGAALLSKFASIPDLEDSIRRFYRVRHFVFIPELLVLNSIVSIKATLQGHSTSASHLQNLSKAVFINTSRALDFSRCQNPKLIHELITGPYLRWEIIGIIFTLLALSSQAVSDERGEQSESQARQEFTFEMARASEDCLSFCDSTEHLNDLVAWYQYESFLLQTSLHGDTSNFAWRRLGDLATTIYALGMHQEIDASVDVSCFFKESRKKCFGAAYTLDKAVATLLGRPPRLSSLYATQTIPLNLSDEETMAEGEALRINLNKLDVNGWNTDGVIRCCSWIRTRTLVAFIREEVLQLSLGVGRVDTEARALDALSRSRTMWDSIPPLMKYEPAIWSTRKSAKECYMLLIIYLDHLYSTFLLQRIIAKHTGSDSSELYDSAWALLSATLTLCRERDRLSGIQDELSWTIVYNGLPSAGLLALELLRKAQQSSSYQSHLLIPRAELIRSLSVFIDALEWVARPGHGNYALCLASKKVLTQILDAVLDPQSYREPQTLNGGIGNGNVQAMGLNGNAGSPSEDSAVGLQAGPWSSVGDDSGEEKWGIGEWEQRLMGMEVGMESAGTIDWDAWIST